MSLEPHGNGTKYTALAIHGEEADRKKHEEMAFHEGWGRALDQLVAIVKIGKLRSYPRRRFRDGERC